MSLNSKTRRQNRPLHSVVSCASAVDAGQADPSKANLSEPDPSEPDSSAADVIDFSEGAYEFVRSVISANESEDRRRQRWTPPHVSTLQPILNAGTDRRSPVPIFTLNLEGVILAVNRSGAERLGYAVDWLVGSTLVEILHPGDRSTFQAYLAQLAAEVETQTTDSAAAPDLALNLRYLCQTGEVLGVQVMAQTLYAGNASPTLLLGGEPLDSLSDLSQLDEKKAQLPSPEDAARSLTVQLTAEFTHQIQQSVDSKDLLTTAVTRIQQQLQADRVLVYRTYDNSTGSILAEAALSDGERLLGQSLPASLFPREEYQTYALGRVQAIADVDQASIADGLRAALQQFGVQAMLVVPIVRQTTLWGLFVVHQSKPRYWQPWEIDLTSQLANQLATLLYPLELYSHVQHLNADLERQIQQRTAQLELAFEFEATLKRITDKVRDSLDEDQILQVAVQELATVIGVNSCNAALYDLDEGTTTVRYEYTTFLSPYQGRTSKLADFSEIYDQLLRGQWLQFCSMTPNPVRGYVSTLVTPIVDDQGVLGDLWLVNHKYYAFNEQDIRMAQQVANQCAIAIRQARLYQASQAQIEELEKLNQLKDDFLSTVSHELRTPMTNIKMAIQMLEILLTQSGTLTAEENRVPRYFKILREESEREINLINDLLDVSRLNAGTEKMTLSAVDLHGWLWSVIHPFEERARNHQQQLELSMPTDFPKLVTDAFKLQRIITELLTNACKYTPAGELIQITVESIVLEGIAVESTAGASQAAAENPVSQRNERGSEGSINWKADGSNVLLSALVPAQVVQIRIVNRGVEISPEESDRIFEKFYRIPNHDPWQYGGIGLGLALVKKLVEQIQGTIHLESQAGQTCFVLELPSHPHVE